MLRRLKGVRTLLSQLVTPQPVNPQPVPSTSGGLPLEVVTWVDSCGLRNGWAQLPEDLPEPTTVYSAGYVLKETAEYVTIAGHVSFQDTDHSKIELATQGDGVISIPKVAILSRRAIL